MDVEQFTLEVDGIPLAAEFCKPHPTQEGQAAPGLVLCHGIPAGPPDPANRGYALLAERFCDAGFATLIFNFRGAGLSGGDFDILGWTRDLAGVLDYLFDRPEVDRSRFLLMGSSAGAAVSVYAAARDRRVTGLACFACPAEFSLVGNPADARRMLDHSREVGSFRSPGFPPSVEDWVAGFGEVSPLRWVDRIAPRPLLLVHGDEDDVVNVSQARALHEKAGEPKELVILPGAGHRLRQEPRAVDVAFGWLKGQAGLEE
ncbi:MAG: alpha/beta fold hydrolase [Dehalococcoidia bacterium]